MLIDDYIEYSNTYKIKYGDKCIVLMQVGSFYEMYSIKDDMTEEIYQIADLCKILVSKKNKSIKEVSISNPLMAGFPLYTIRKFTNILLENNYTIVLIEQVTPPPNPERKVTEILSPGMNIDVESKNSNYMMVLYYEYINELPVVGISGVDLSTGNSFVYEVGSTKTDPEFTNDEVYRLLTAYNPCELIILSDKDYGHDKKNYLIKSLNLSCIMTHFKWETFEHILSMSKISYQISLLEKVFTNKYMMTIIEYLNIEKYMFGRIALCCLLQFAYEHNADIIKKINVPEILNDTSFLNIEYNSAIQLNVLGIHKHDKPLINILNRCNTSFGSRAFKDRILKPIVDKEVLKQRYDAIDFMLTDKKFYEISKNLCHILDLERIKRKMAINKMNPCEWYGFNTSIENAISILEEYYNDDDLVEYKDMIDYYTNILDLEECCKYNLCDIKGNIFVKGIYEEIDKCVENIENTYSKIVEICNNINKIGTGDTTSCKIEYNDRESYYISMTKKRYDTAKAKDGLFMKSFNIKQQTSTCNVKLSNNEISNFSQTIEKNESIIVKSVIKAYKEFVTDFISKYDNIIGNLIKKVIEIDIACCNARNAYEYRYYRPEIIEDEASFIKANDIRHPIVERITDSTEYIGNDIDLSPQNRNGMLLYGINSSGKSTLMKSIGLNIIMAQSGMFVASSKMEFSPYKHIFTRISGMDNIYKGMSSFVVEMTELRNILQRCDKNSLVLGDEICCGTESTSAVAIVAAGIETLVEKKSSFIFATHLHELVNIKKIKHMIEFQKYISVCHVHISIDNNNRIIFNRKLMEGKGHDTYGIEVCKSLDMPNIFMRTAEEIRKEMMGMETIITNTTSSRYNNDIYISKCKICNKPAEDTHHIKYQCNSDSDGFFTNHHKNVKHNLITLCKECHNKEHNGTIKIKGYIETTEGVVVDLEDNVQKLSTEIENTDDIDCELTFDEIKKLKQYVKRGKCNEWYVRSARTNKFKKSNEVSVLKAIQKHINYKNIVEITDTISNLLYDYTM